MQTVFKLVVSAPEDDILVPNTGFGTASGVNDVSGNQPMLVVLLIVGIVLAIVTAASFYRLYKKSKMSFGITPKRSTLIVRSLMAIVAVCSLGYAGNALRGQDEVVKAADGDTEASLVQSSGELTVNAVLDEEEPVIVCGIDSVRITRSLPSGYTMRMKATALANEDDESIVIETIGEDTEEESEDEGTGEGEETGEDGIDGEEDNEEAEEEEEDDSGLANSVWAFAMVDNDGSDGEFLPIPATLTNIFTTQATEPDGRNVDKFKYCVRLTPETEPGTYVSTITYAVDPTPVNYSLTLDANGGAFATAVEPLVSPDTTEMSYEFEIPNVTPTVPATPAGLNFYGWSLTGDSLSDVYVAGDTIEVTEIETTLKAVYGFRKYTITYDKNTTETVQNFVPTQFCIITDNEADTCNVIITKRVPTVSGFTLLGWRETDVYVPGENDNIDQARSKVELKPGDLTTLDSDITLHAIWWAVSTNDFQVELRWGEEPHDLDSHLAIVDNASGRVVKEVYFSNKNVEIESGNINLIANLDIDDLSSYGPETITLNLLPVSAYSNYSFYYFIKNYSGENRGLLKDSGANVTLIRKGGDTTVYEVSDVYGDSNVIWNVFAIKNGQIVERNTFTASPETSY